MISDDLKKFIVYVLRRSTYRWPARNEALKKARTARGMYRCNMCQEIFPKKETQIDHVQPVVRLSGFTTFDDYIERMFPSPEGFQILCILCHDSKTQIENNGRHKIRKEKKNVKTD